MKTLKKGLGGWILTEKKPMKIYWKYGKEIDILLYIDRIIFIKIHIHVQEPVWSCVLCQSLLIRDGCVPSGRGCTVLEVFVPQYLILFQLPFPPLLPLMCLQFMGKNVIGDVYPVPFSILENTALKCFLAMSIKH